MALLDHFHPPLAPQYQWHSFHHAWCVYLATSLNRLLPKRYHAAPHVQFGIEIDVAALDTTPPKTLHEVMTVPYLTVTNAEQIVDQDQDEMDVSIDWQSPPPAQIIPFSLMSESVEVLIYNSVTNPSLVGAVELVSEANKDRPAERQAFVAKCEAYLRQGVGLVIVDIVTTYRTNLHDALLAQLDAPQIVQRQSPLYMTAYRPMRQDERTSLAIWQEALTLGQALPTMPLWLRREFCAPLQLEATYQETCQALRIPIQITSEVAAA
jgi:hypothetical protein